jgi:hypothetical protein
MDDSMSGEHQDREEMREHLTEGSTWLRLIYMLLFGFAFYVSVIILLAVAVLQILFKLFTGEPVRRLRELGQSLGMYLYEIAVFETFQSEVKPYPFRPWPRAPQRRTAGSRATGTGGANGPRPTGPRNFRVRRENRPDSGADNNAPKNGSDNGSTGGSSGADSG